MYIILVLIVGAVKLKARRTGSALEPGKRLSGRLSELTEVIVEVQE